MRRGRLKKKTSDERYPAPAGFDAERAATHARTLASLGPRTVGERALDAGLLAAFVAAVAAEIVTMAAVAVAIVTMDAEAVGRCCRNRQHGRRGRRCGRGWLLPWPRPWLWPSLWFVAMVAKIHARGVEDNRSGDELRWRQ